MISPLLSGEAFLYDVNAPLEADDLRIWWLGQSGFLLRFGEHRLIFDPYLSDSLTRKYAETDKPHVRMSGQVIEPALLTGIHVITSTHIHTDHLDAETLQPLLASNPDAELVIPEANRHFAAERLSIPLSAPTGLDAGTEAEVGPFRITGIAAAHNALDLDPAGHHLYLGYIVRCGAWTVYHSGDTLLYPDLPEVLAAQGAIDVAFLPINGNKPERRVAGNLDGREAAELAHEAGIRWVVPCHYDMFDFNTADPAELFIPACERLGQQYRVLKCGEGWTVPKQAVSLPWVAWQEPAS